jgi:hypothetical protein
MPKIPLVWQGREQRFNFLRVLAAMIYPKSELERGQLYAALVQSRLAPADYAASDMNDLFGLLRILRALPSALSKESFGREAERRFSHGLIAGMILDELFRLEQHAQGGDTLGKAKAIVQKGLIVKEQDERRRRQSIGRKREGGGIPSGYDSLDTAWLEFRGVSHFYAAIVIQKRTTRRPTILGGARPRSILPVRTLLEFLALAKALAYRGLAHKSPRASVATLLRAEIWTAPAPPGTLPLVTVSHPPLDKNELQVLSDYRSEK